MTQDIAPVSIWTKIPSLTPYALLARWDRPVGFLLTLWPALWGLILAPHYRTIFFQTKVFYILIFIIGAIAVRGAGCTINDIIDCKLDAKVERTKTRPLASGQLTVTKAIIFLVLQLAVGAWVLFQLSPMAIGIGIAIIPLITIYPLMKRITWLPQVFLGIVFNAGVLIAWATLENTITAVPVMLYLAAFFWTIAYDTVYAHLDLADDSLIGVKSTARLWGPDSKLWVFGCWLAFLICFGIALILSHTHWAGLLMFSLVIVVLITGHIFWNPLNRRYTLGFFQLQAKIGFLLTLAALAPVLF
jgi:4-hydroxybenzoate polyprenyltransferase